ncbi:helix-turn-helix transcriptional regulator [Mangrovicoccus sp. HB161399]|uniref:helix-turn-helix transcriptional regulator n=1 Tax=Mangrovicoccus sp. HB161399 TaxID=2720392 RepID=UPI001554DC50|nr:helix-turn-helix transcriptional regulator [Mangrovicoccus sp. HB161399]
MSEDLFAAICEAGLQSEGWPAALEMVSDRLAGTPLFLGHGEIRNFPRAEAWTVRYDPAALASFEGGQDGFEENPGFGLIARAPAGTLVDRSMLYGAGLPMGDGAARHFIERPGMHHFLLSAVQRDRDVFSPLFLARPRGAPFDSRERRMVEELCSHLGRAMRLRRALDLRNAAGLGYARALDRLGEGVILTGGDLRIRHMNLAAEAMAARRDGILRHRGRLRLASRAAQARLEALARRVSGPEPDYVDGRVMVPRPSHAMPYALTVMPLAGDASCAFSGAPQVLVLASDPEARAAQLSPQRLALDYGLTGAEARIAALAARALPVPEIGRHAGISANTVKTHLKSVYGKLGVHGQAELVRLLMAQAQTLPGG